MSCCRDLTKPTVCYHGHPPVYDHARGSYHKVGGGLFSSITHAINAPFELLQGGGFIDTFDAAMERAPRPSPGMSYIPERNMPPPGPGMTTGQYQAQYRLHQQELAERFSNHFFEKPHNVPIKRPLEANWRPTGIWDPRPNGIQPRVGGGLPSPLAPFKALGRGIAKTVGPLFHSPSHSAPDPRQRVAQQLTADITGRDAVFRAPRTNP